MSFSYPVINLADSLLSQLGPLITEKWKTWLEKYLDSIYWETIITMIIQKAKIEYYGPKQKIISSNLLLVTNNPDTLTVDLKN